MVNTLATIGRFGLVSCMFKLIFTRSSDNPQDITENSRSIN
ncbi:hypothetical protein [Candidatus Arthromitus sp. SFB-mouse]|nr:hypothetical protein [Candidatus Arthromitus sp. SFB-mouse]EGX28648.1 hypothetical protein SFBNYU_006710 [Candidatus Arthromitus sp. SFB-mouse-NYU]